MAVWPCSSPRGAGRGEPELFSSDTWSSFDLCDLVRCMERVTWKLSDIMCKIGSQWEFAVGLRELKHGLCNNLEGWEWAGSGRDIQEGRYICIPMLNSC